MDLNSELIKGIHCPNPFYGEIKSVVEKQNLKITVKRISNDGNVIIRKEGVLNMNFEVKINHDLITGGELKTIDPKYVFIEGDLVLIFMEDSMCNLALIKEGESLLNAVDRSLVGSITSREAISC